MTNFLTVPSKSFERDIRKLSAIDQKRVLEKVRLLESDPYHPSLRTKKLRSEPDNYESSVNMDIRIIWRLKNKTIIFLLDVGHHDILKRY
jgi:mRNA interferase RelE/StbE